jgi:hypothetical protein
VTTSFARGHAITAAGNGGLVAVDNDEWFDKCLVRRRWGRRSETYLYGSRKGEGYPRFGPLTDGTPYDESLMSRAVRANVRASADHLRQGSPVLEQLIQTSGLLVVGAEYSLDTGVVDFFDIPGA